MLFLSVALAGMEIFVDEPVTLERTDAPKDGVLVFVGRWVGSATLVVGGEEVPLVLRETVGGYDGALVEVSPPENGWPVGVPLFVHVEADGYESSLAFQAVDALAEPPGPIQLTHVDPNSWSDTIGSDASLDWRPFGMEVERSDTDPWSGVIVRHADRPEWTSALAIGAGPLSLRALQYDLDGLQPECFEILNRSASGELGPPVEFCSRRGPTCSSTKGGVLGVLALLPLVGRLRRRRSPVEG